MSLQLVLQLMLQINDHNVTYSTHDDVVSIIRKAKKTLKMKVITPVINPAHRTSIQLQKQVQVFNGTSKGVSVKVEAPHKAQEEQIDRETFIGDSPKYRGVGQESPALDHMKQASWDSSQSQDEEVAHITTAHVPEKSSYLSPAAAFSAGHLNVPTHHSFTPPPPGSMNKAVHSEPTQNTNWSAKSTTLPPTSKGTAIFVDSDSSISDEESEFTKALRKGKAKLANSPAMRHRSNTLPSQQKQQTKYQQDVMRQPLAAAIMKKIDSMKRASHSDFSSDDEEKMTQLTREKKPKAAPPAPKPKPLAHSKPLAHFNRAHTVDYDVGPKIKQGTVADIKRAHLLSSWNAQNTPMQTAGHKADHNEDHNIGSVDWKSSLRPLKRTASGRASPEPSSLERNVTSDDRLVSGSEGRAERYTAVSRSPLHRQPFVDTQTLPQPLPPTDKRISAGSMEIPPPPPNFSSVHTHHDTSTHTAIPPPSHNNYPSSEPSSPPPPLPNSSPPRDSFEFSNQNGGFVTSHTSKGSARFSGPLPSPLRPSSFEESFESEAHENDQQLEAINGDVHRLHSSQLAFPGPSAECGTGQDLDEAIRALEQFSDSTSEHKPVKREELPTTSQKINIAASMEEESDRLGHQTVDNLSAESLTTKQSNTNRYSMKLWYSNCTVMV